MNAKENNEVAQGFEDLPEFLKRKEEKQGQGDAAPTQEPVKQD